jgi:hypothetical protein
LQCTLHRLQLSQQFLLAILLRNISFFANSKSYHNAQFLNTLLNACIFVVVLCRFQPQADGHPTTHILYQVTLTLFIALFMCVSHSSLHFDFFSVPNLPLFCNSPFFCPTLASNSYSSWDECPSNLWTLPTFSKLANMNCDDLTSPVTAAATAQGKLCPYNEEEPHIWFGLIEA